MAEPLLFFTGNSNPELAKEIASHLKARLGDATVTKFQNGETYARFNQSVRGKDIFILQSLCEPVNDNLMELLVLADAAKRSSAETINAVIPWYGYSLQDRQTQPREPITAKLVANLLQTAGINRILTMDLHVGQIQGFFVIPVDHVTAIPLFADYLKKQKLHNPVVVSPDAGGTKRARILAKELNAPIAMIDKRRPKPGEAEIMNVVGEVNGKTCIVVDDIVNSGSTLAPVSKALLARGATGIYICATHPILCGPAVQRLKETQAKEIVLTNTIPVSKEKRLPNVRILSVGKLLADAIQMMHAHKSLSDKFEQPLQ